MPIIARDSDAPSMAAIHAESLPPGWGADIFSALLAQDGVFALVEGKGFILCRVVLDEAEILTFAVSPAGRRQQSGQKLADAAMQEAKTRGAAAMFLEVAADNVPALLLYRKNGFQEVGRRRGYYTTPVAAGEGAKDAIVMRRDLA